MTSCLFRPTAFGDIQLANRVVMAPMTRNRAGPGNVPTDLMITHYVQRASAGLIITEATQVVPEGQGYPATPGIHSEDQIAGWRRVTEAVHEAGGQIVLQLWHVGRVSHSMYQPGGKLPVAPSAIAPAGQVYGLDWKKVDYETPRALEASELPGIVEGFVKGAANAKLAGFDGVEVHGANGYLLDQFLRDGSNKRTDGYGGGIANRARLLLETIEAVCGVWGADRVGVRLSPHNPYNDMIDSDPRATFTYVAEALAPMRLAYAHLVEPLGTPAEARLLATYVARCGAPVITNGDYTREAAEALIEAGKADAVAFGKPFLANPDLPARFERGAELNPPDFKTFFGGSEKGYTDYPALAG